MTRGIPKYRNTVAALGVIVIFLILQACSDVSQVTGVQDRVSVSMDTMTVYTVQLTDVNLQPIDKQETNEGMAFRWSDTLSNQLRFEAVPSYTVLDSTVITKRKMEEHTSYEVVNPVTSTNANANFNFSKPVLFQDIKVQAGHNFLADSVMRQYVDFPLKLHPEGRGQVKLDMDHFFIPPKKYTVIATWKTEEGEVFTDSTEVFINLN